VTAIALRLLEDYAPERPVRLLGVRVTGLVSPQIVSFEPASASRPAGAKDQLAMPV
jgi:hypothetical protein